MSATGVRERDAIHTDREQLLDRLHNLRAVLPVFAQELASARRQAARLRVENGKLLEQVRELQPSAHRSHLTRRAAA